MSLRKKSITLYFQNNSRGGTKINKNVWGTMKPVLTNKDHINNKEIIIKKGSKTINEGRELSEAFKQVLCKFCGKYIYNQ